MNRIAIIGSAGSGKSTLARQLGDVTGLPVVHLDREHWGPGWVAPTDSAWQERVARLAAEPTWILDGNYGGTMALRFAAADTVIFLDLPRRTCLWRVLRRSTIGRRRRPDLADGCEEKFDFAFLRWVWQYNATRRPGILKMLWRLPPPAKVVVLTRESDIRSFLATLAADPPPS